MIKYYYAQKPSGTIYEKNGKDYYNIATKSFSHKRGLKLIKSVIHNVFLHEINQYNIGIRTATALNKGSELYIELAHTLITLNQNDFSISYPTEWPNDYTPVSLNYIQYNGLINHLSELPTRKAVMYEHFNRLSNKNIIKSSIIVDKKVYSKAVELINEPDTKEAFIAYFEFLKKP
jgi:hypothetical protein